MNEPGTVHILQNLSLEESLLRGSVIDVLISQIQLKPDKTSPLQIAFNLNNVLSLTER